MLSVKISNAVATGHAQLPQAILQSLKVRQHGRLRLQSITLATQMQARSISLHPMPSKPAPADAAASAPAQQAKVTEELSEPDLKQLLAAWLAAQASMVGSADPGEHVPVQQCTVVQLTAGTNAATEQHNHLAFKVYMKQPPSLRADPLASYALLSAADFAPGSKLSVSQGGPVLAEQDWVPPQAPSEQLHERQAAMLSSSEALRAAASSALKHLLPLLAFSARYRPANCLYRTGALAVSTVLLHVCGCFLHMPTITSHAVSMRPVLNHKVDGCLNQARFHVWPDALHPCCSLLLAYAQGGEHWLMLCCTPACTHASLHAQ